MKIIILIVITAFNTALFSQELTVDIKNSNNESGLQTNCSNDFVCFDLLMSVNEIKHLDSYNIWVSYDNLVLSRTNGGADSSCVIANGGDTNLEDEIGAFRVGGLPSLPYLIGVNTSKVIHTICFKIIDIDNYIGTKISVGGDKYSGALKSVVTFNDASIVTKIKENTIVVDSLNANCVSSNNDIIETIHVTDVDDFNKELNFSLFPNPTPNIIKIELNNASEGVYSFQIFNNIGQEHYQSNASMISNFKKEIDISLLRSGIYYLKISMKDKVLIKSFMISK